MSNRPITIVQRVSDPSFVIKIWKSICEVRGKKIPCNISQLITHMSLKFRCLPHKSKDEIVLALYDGLVVLDEEDRFLIPAKIQPPGRTDRDMYCFNCHQPGSVISCKKCYRVVHPNCWESEDQFENCRDCLLVSEGEEDRIRGKIPTKDQISEMLYGIMKEIQLKYRELNDLYTYSSEADRQMWRLLLFKPKVDFDFIMDKVNRKEYTRICDFDLDFRTLRHNVTLIFGSRSIPGSKANSAYTFVMDQGNSIRDCIDCYLNWLNRTENPDWFSLPCDPVHEVRLVATENGYLVPAKVLMEQEEFYSVRLFGFKNVNEIVANASVQSIGNRLPIPKRPGESEAFKEFRKYQNNLRAQGYSVPEELSIPQPNMTALDQIRRKSGLESARKKSGADSIRLKDGTQARPSSMKREKGTGLQPTQSVISRDVSNHSEEEDEVETKFRAVQADQDEEYQPGNWVRRSSRKRQPVRRYIDQLAGMKTKRVKREKIEELDDDEDEENCPSLNRFSVATHVANTHVSGPVGQVPKLKIEKSTTGKWTSTSGDATPLKASFMPQSATSVREQPYGQSTPAAIQVFKKQLFEKEQQLQEKDRQLSEGEERHHREIQQLKSEFYEQESFWKKQQWCAVCLGKARMYCCFDHSYCSTACQNGDWQEGHRHDCKRGQNVNHGAN